MSEVDERAQRWMESYYPGPNCRADRCQHYRSKDSDSGPWCWLMHGIGAEGRENECPAYVRSIDRKGDSHG